MDLTLRPLIIPHVESTQPEAQCGSRPGRGCTDQLFALRVLQESSAARRLPLLAAFVDLAKAFDSIDRRLLVLMLRASCMPDKLVRIFESMYNHTSCAVRQGKKIGPVFQTSSGVQQGCLSGSWGFIMYIHFALEPILPDLQRLGVSVVYSLRDGRRLDAAKLKVSSSGAITTNIGTLLIVDDTTIMATDVDSFRAGLKLLYEQFRRYGLMVNVAKSAAVHFGGWDALQCELCSSADGARDATILCDSCDRAFHLRCLKLPSLPLGPWRCDGCGGAAAATGKAASCARESAMYPTLPVGDGILEWTKSTKYLGVTVHEDCGLDAELTSRIAAARAALKKLRPLVQGGKSWRHMRSCFAQSYRLLVITVLLYGCEVWALSTKQLQRIEVAHRSMLRSALPRRHRGAHISNAKLHKMFRIPTAEALVAKAQLQWL